HRLPRSFPTRRSSDLDLAIGRPGGPFEKCRSGHDLARLAIAALRDGFFDPCELDPVSRVRGKAFDGFHVAPDDAGGIHIARLDQDRKSTRLNSSHVKI